MAPGLAYVLRHERVVPTGPKSVFRETLRVVFVSVASLTVAGLLVTLLRWLFPGHTPNVRGLVRDPRTYAQEHHVHLAWWAFAIITFATLLAWGMADPRAVRAVRWLTRSRSVRWLIAQSEADIIEVSTWYRAFEELKTTNGVTIVGVLQDNGSYVQGTLVSYSAGMQDYEQRELILTDPLKLTNTAGETCALPASMVILSARNLVRIDVTHMAEELATSPE